MAVVSLRRPCRRVERRAFFGSESVSRCHRRKLALGIAAGGSLFKRVKKEAADKQSRTIVDASHIGQLWRLAVGCQGDASFVPRASRKTHES